jgi:hypothetical protein
MFGLQAGVIMRSMMAFALSTNSGAAHDTGLPERCCGD